MLSLDKKSLPSYIYKLNVALVIFFAFWFTVVVAVMVAIGCIYGENVITYGVMVGGFALFFVGLAIFWIVDNKLYKRLIGERVAELEKEFAPMPSEEGKRILKERGIITDGGFVAGDGVFGKEIIPIGKAKLIFNISAVKDIELKIFLYGGADCDVMKASYPFDGAMNAYIGGTENELNGNAAVSLLRSDKQEFVKAVTGYKKIFKWKFN